MRRNWKGVSADGADWYARKTGAACLPVLMVDHNVMRLHIAVHDALAVAEVERFEQLVDVVADIDVVELWVEAAEVGVVYVFEDERRGFALRIPDDVEERNDIGPASQVLENLNFALDLLLLDGLEDLDDAFLVVDDVDTLEDFGVFAAAWDEASAVSGGGGEIDEGAKKPGMREGKGREGKEKMRWERKTAMGQLTNLPHNLVVL